MRLPSKRISDYEADVRKRQPKLDKLLARARCISSECDALTLEERMIVAKRLDEIADMLRRPKIDRVPSVLKKASDSGSRSREITGH